MIKLKQTWRRWRGIKWEKSVSGSGNTKGRGLGVGTWLVRSRDTRSLAAREQGGKEVNIVLRGEGIKEGIVQGFGGHGGDFGFHSEWNSEPIWCFEQRSDKLWLVLAGSLFGFGEEAKQGQGQKQEHWLGVGCNNLRERNDGSLDSRCSAGVGEQWSDSGYILKMGLGVFTDWMWGVKDRSQGWF